MRWNTACEVTTWHLNMHAKQYQSREFALIQELKGYLLTNLEPYLVYQVTLVCAYFG